MSSFVLCCELEGHQKDVRAVCPAVYPEGAVVTGSRDVTTRLWHANGAGAGFTEGSILSGHSGFVSAVCCLPPTDRHLNGLIVTGSNDNNINVYDFESSLLPLYTLPGHTDNVCCLSAGRHGTLLSGSWDKTAKVWHNQTNIMTLSGHNLAVWCVLIMPENGYMITGSADKTIKIWKTGKCEQTLTGHDDCVRGLCLFNSMEFLSCSNDSSVRRWSLSGHALQVYYSHMNFVYSVAAFPAGSGGGAEFVSVSEDRSLKVWSGGECVQTITHPCTSVWCVCVLPNGDIVTGSSDGLVRVFTQSADRSASTDLQAAFEEKVSASEIPTQVGDIHVDQLPGPEALLAPGKKDGDTKMVRQGTAVEAHQWSATEQRWIKVGDVVGSTGSGSGRTLHEGKEYDFVFSVAIEDGQPAFSLPYNMTEDPWYAAQRFIDRHNLDQAFLTQIHDFIVENTKSVSMNQLPADRSYRDPFTGGSSYIPGGSSNPMSSNTTAGSDPFTGSGRYVPPPAGGGEMAYQSGPGSTTGADPFTGASSYRPPSSFSSSSAPQISNAFFPQKQVVTFNAIKPDAVIGKLKEFNQKLSEEIKCNPADLESMSQLCDLDKQVSSDRLDYLWRLLKWPEDKLFPAVDILRVALRNAASNEYLSDTNGKKLFEFLTTQIAVSTILQNQIVCLRALSNLPAHPSGQKLLLTNADTFIPLAAQAGESQNKNVQIAAVTAVLNASVLLQFSSDSEAKSEVLAALSMLAGCVTDAEAKFRLCVGVGTLIWTDEACKREARDLADFKSTIASWRTDRELSKLQDCASTLAALL